VDAAKNDNASFAHAYKSDRKQRTNRLEDDGGIQFDGRLLL
jgi:hypothetical protein